MVVWLALLVVVVEQDHLHKRGGLDWKLVIRLHQPLQSWPLRRLPRLPLEHHQFFLYPVDILLDQESANTPVAALPSHADVESRFPAHSGDPIFLAAVVEMRLLVDDPVMDLVMEAADEPLLALGIWLAGHEDDCRVAQWASMDGVVEK